MKSVTPYNQSKSIDNLWICLSTTYEHDVYFENHEYERNSRTVYN